MDINILDLIVTIVVGGLTLLKIGEWLRGKKVDVIASKTEAVLEKVADGMDGLALLAKGAGFQRVADVVEAAADIPDELGDVAGKIAEMTANDDFTKERVMELIAEGKEVAVEAKEFVLVIKKK